MHALTPPKGAAKLRVERNALHGSVDTYYECAAVCNVVVLKANDKRIVWKYNSTPRQSARPYVSGVQVEASKVVKVARRPHKEPTVVAVHPVAWAAKIAGTREPRGDVVAHLNRLKMLGHTEELLAEIGQPRAGAPICVYLQ